MNLKIIQQFIDDHIKRFSKETIRSYNIALRQFFSFCEKSYEDVKATDIRAWHESMEEAGLKQRSIHLKLSALKSFYRYCMEENLIKKSPTINVHTPKKDDCLPCYLNRHQLELLREWTKRNPRERAIVETLYSTGLRISELLQIKLEDIKWESKQIWVREGKGTKDRFVMFTHDCAERLKTYLDQRKYDNEYLFSNNRGGHLSRVTVEKWFQEYSEGLGFKVMPHTMRHTFAAHLAEKNMPQSYIQEMMGHSNINSTRIYTRLRENARKKIYDRFQV
jgi:site-specific recombinase XerD